MGNSGTKFKINNEKISGKNPNIYKTEKIHESNKKKRKKRNQKVN
jgi:hypothetical protein